MHPFPHIVQSPEWGEFKTAVGRKTVRVDNIQFSLHPIPFFKWKIGYCPKIHHLNFDWETVKAEAKKHNCFAVRFDVPNIVRGSELADQAIKEFEKHCQKAPTDTFAKQSIFLDISKPENELLADMKHKTRYNIKLAQKKGVIVREENDDKSFGLFLQLQREAAHRHHFFLHPDNYYRKLWQILQPKGMCHLLIAYCQDQAESASHYDTALYHSEKYEKSASKKNHLIPLAAWLLFTYQHILYYPYGGSSLRHRNLMASNLLAWEAIRLAKKLNCVLFDMWGACSLNDKKNPWYGFTRFKLGYGGELVKFIPSYDLVIEPVKYHLFVRGYRVFWRVIKFIKALKH